MSSRSTWMSSIRVTRSGSGRGGHRRPNVRMAPFKPALPPGPRADRRARAGRSRRRTGRDWSDRQGSEGLVRVASWLGLNDPGVGLDPAGEMRENDDMEVRGRIHNGVVVLEGALPLPEGTMVTVSYRGCAAGEFVRSPSESPVPARTVRAARKSPANHGAHRRAAGRRGCFFLTSTVACTGLRLARPSRGRQ